MESINWSNYSGEEFQLFCNALLSFEIGKQFRPFNAPGKDYGIDGQFDGSYTDKIGSWRFQYKFHKVARQKAISLLKEDLKKEVNKIQNEAHFVLLTNVELLPQEFQVLHDQFNRGIEYSNTLKSFEIWDGAKIFALYLRHPLLRLWLSEGFTTSILLDYKISFEKYLAAGLEDSYTLGNYFVAREDKLNELRNFYCSEKSTSIIIGEAGIGKTRLAIEFFKSLEKENEDIHCLVLMSKHFDFDKVKQAFSGAEKIVILVDDAHEYSPGIINDLITITRLSPNVKLILTCRQLQFLDSLKFVKEYEQNEMFQLNLTELSREDTTSLFKYELEGHYLSHFLGELTEISYGKPILIVLLLKAAKAGIHIESIKSQGFLVSYVTNYFNGLNLKIVDECQVSKLNANSMLKVICLLEPFNYNDSKIANKIASFLQLQYECVAFCLKELRESGFVSGRYDHSIKPDYYSDIYLKSTPAEFIESCIKEFPEYLNNIIINLSSVDEIQKQSNSILDEVLNFYVSRIKDHDTRVINNIFDVVLDIEYVKPGIAQKAIVLFIEGLKTPGHSLADEFLNYKSYFLSISDTVFGKALRVLVNLLYKTEFYSFVYNSIFQLNQILKISDPLSKVFKFSKRDFVENYDLGRQLFFVETFKSEFKTLSVAQIKFGIDCCSIFLIHDFDHTASESNGKQLTITTYFIPDASKVKKLRKSIIQLFFEIYRNISDADLQKEILHKLIDIPRGIFSTRNNKTIYKGDDEIESVLVFLKNECSNFHFSFQKEILDKLYWYVRWGIDGKFLKLIDEIKLLLTPKSFIEKLIHLFAKSEISNDYRKAEEYIKDQSRILIENNTPQVIAEALNEINNYHNNEFYYFHLFIRELTSGFVEKSQAVYNILWANGRGFIYRYGADILQAQYFKHKQDAFYWDKTKELLGINEVQADDVLLQVYTFYQASVLKLSEQDLALIEKIFEKRNPENNFSLARSLVAYLVNNPEKGERICMEFLNAAGNREAEVFFLFLHDNLNVIYNQLKNLFLGATIRLNLDYNIEVCFNEVCKREGISVVLEYLIRRFEYKKLSLASDSRNRNYDFLPDGEHSHLFDGVEESIKYELFANALNWYISVPFNPLEQLFAVELLDYLKQTSGMNTVHNNIFQEAKRKCIDKNHFVALLEAIAIFHNKDNSLIDLVVEIYLLAFQANSTDVEYVKDLNFKAYVAITTVGVKSGTAGLPFQVDIDLRDLVETHMKKYDEQSPAFKLLRSVFNSVERDIEHSHDRNNETW